MSKFDSVVPEFKEDTEVMRAIAKKWRERGIRFGFFMGLPAVTPAGEEVIAVLATCSDEVIDKISANAPPEVALLGMLPVLAFTMQLLDAVPAALAPSEPVNLDEFEEHDLHLPDPTAPVH